MRSYKTTIQKENLNEKKGREFERYVAELISNDFAIEEWTTDIINKTKGVFVEANMNPDFVLRHKETKERFAIECKYRSQFLKKDDKELMLEWSKPDQLKRYKDYEKKEKIPVFIMIGVEGTPGKPDYLFCIPLSELKYPKVFQRIFEKWERIPDKELFWKNNLIL